MKHRRKHPRAVLPLAGISFAIVCPTARAVIDQHFDYTSFETGFQQPHFDVLNYPSINGNYMMTSTDNHRPEMVANGNALAEFYNNFNADYNHPTAERRTPAQEAAFINNYTLTNSTKNGVRPDWLILNEISSSQWQLNPGVPSLSEHRTWVIDTVTILNDTYGYKVITYSPYETVGTANGPSWQALAAKSYVAIESYQSGTEVWNSGGDNASRLAWVQGKYQSSKNTYLAAGVPASRLFISEHFANNGATFINSQGQEQAVGWGRAGLASAADWDTVIMLRQDALKNVGFDGFLAYNWGGNGMGVTQAEQLQHEYYYRSRLVMDSQQPQWLSDNTLNVNGTTIPLSWNQPLNWLGGVPNASGAIANFYRTNTAARTITLDGNKSVGVLGFNSPQSYTISAGSGGTLTMSNGALVAGISVPQGSHTIGVPLSIASNTTIDVAGGLTINNGISTASSRTMTRTGSGTFTINGTQTYAAGTIFNANGGTTNFNSSGGSNLSVVVNASVFFNTTQTLSNLSIGSGGFARLAAGSNRVINTNSFNMAGGKLDLTNNDLIVRSGTLGSWTGSAYNGITGYVQSGRSDGSWNGSSGLVTSISTATTSVLTTLAVAKASEALGITSSQTTTWNGQSVNGNAILVMYTWGGDADLNGELNGDDYFWLDSNILMNGSVFGFHNGDFNYDGSLDGDDYFILDSNIVTAQNSGSMASSLAAVPEPVGMGVLSALAVIGLRRRRSLTVTPRTRGG